MPDLLRQANSQSVEISGNVQLLAIHGLTVRIFPPPVDKRTRLLALIARPMVAYILLLIEVYGPISNCGPSEFGGARRAGWNLPASGAVCLLGHAGL